MKRKFGVRWCYRFQRILLGLADRKRQLDDEWVSTNTTKQDHPCTFKSGEACLSKKTIPGEKGQTQENLTGRIRVSELELVVQLDRVKEKINSTISRFPPN